MSDFNWGSIGVETEEKPKKPVDIPIDTNTFGIDIPDEAVEFVEKSGLPDTALQEVAGDVYLGQLFGMSPEEAGSLLEPIRKEDPGWAKGLSEIEPNWRSGWIDLHIGQIMYQRLLLQLQTNNKDPEKRKAAIEGIQHIDAQALQLEAGRPEITDPSQQGLFWRSLSSAARMAPIMLKGMEKGARLALPTAAAAAGITAIAGQAGPQIGLPEELVTVPAAFALAFGIGVSTGSAQFIMQVEAGLSMYGMVQEGIDPNVAAAASLGVGIINSLIEVVQIADILKSIPGVDQVINQAIRKTSKELVKSGILKSLARGVMRGGKHTAIETLQELWQESTNIAAEELGKQLTNALNEVTVRPGGRGVAPKRLEATTIREIVERYKQTAIDSALGFGVIQIPGTIARVAVGVEGRAVPEEGPRITEVVPEKKPVEKPKPVTPEERLRETAKTFKEASEFTDYVKKEILSEADLKEIGADPALFESRMEQYWSETKGKAEEIVAPEVTEEMEAKTEAAISWVLQVQEAKRLEATERFKAKREVEFQPLGEKAIEKKEPDNILHPEKQKDVPISAKEVRKKLEESYEKVKDVFFKRRDKRIVLEIPNLKKRLQTEIKTKLHQKKYTQTVKDIDAAIQIHIDSKRNPTDIDRYYELLTEEQRKTVDLSQKLPAEIESVVDKIDEAYKAIGLESKEADVIHNTLENYTARIWDRKGDEAAAIYRKFGTTSRHAKARVFDTILEGWALGYDLKVESATNNLAILQEEMVKTIENKNFLKSMSRTKGIDGSPLVTTKNLEEYKEIKHPNFVTWRYAGKADSNEVYGKNFFVTDKGTLLEKTRMYAPEKIAKNLNNIFGTSALKDIPVLQTITKYNAIIKSWILQSSFFHHLAFARSYFLGVGRKKFKELSIRRAYREGQKAIENMQEEIVLGVENGLTLGLRQDWDESLLQEKTAIENFLAKNKVTKTVADKVSDLRQKHVDFLFGGLGAGLKAKSFLIEFQHEMKRNPNADSNVIAKRVANLINDDFGGLHLERMGRNPTVQHIFRIFALAPDWTESNVRSMVKVFKAGGKQERQMYQRFWTRVLVRGAALTVMANFLMVGGELEELIENYKKAWRAGSLRWLDVDVTPLYQLFGGKTGRRKYFSIFGHFKDPVKFILHPIRSAHYKGSVMYGIFHEAIGGADWAGRKFTTLRELLQTAETVKWGQGRPLSYEQLPSYFLSQLKGIQPVQIQNLISWMNGEMEGFDAIANSMGIGVRTTYP